MSNAYFSNNIHGNSATGELTQCLDSLLTCSNQMNQSEIYSVLGFSTINFPGKGTSSSDDLDVKEEVEKQTEIDSDDNFKKPKVFKTEDSGDFDDDYHDDDYDYEKDIDELCKVELVEKSENDTRLSNVSHKKEKKQNRFKTGQVWNYFEVDPEITTATCKVCQSNLTYSDNISKNMLKHVRVKHPEIHATFTSKNMDGSERGSKQENKLKVPKKDKSGEVWSYFNVDNEACTSVCKICQLQVGVFEQTLFRLLIGQLFPINVPMLL